MDAFRRFWWLPVVSVVLLLFVGSGRAADGVNEQSEEHRAKLVLEEDLRLDVRSVPVMWRDEAFYLLSYQEIQFDLSDDETPRLTARLRGKRLTFDDVRYRLSAAVYDKTGALLGVATCEVPVKRYWMGVCGIVSEERSLDFGPSLAWDRAARYEVTLSEVPVLTPADWAGG